MNNKQTTLRIIIKDGLQLRKIVATNMSPAEYQNLCDFAVFSNPLALQFVPAAIQNKNIILSCIKKNGMAIQYAAPHIRMNNYKLHKEAIKQNFMALSVIRPHDQTLTYSQYKDLAILACKINMSAKGFICKDLPETLYEEILLEIIKSQVDSNCWSLFEELKVINPNSYMIVKLDTQEKYFVKGTTVELAFKNTFGYTFANPDNSNDCYYMIGNDIYHKTIVSEKKKGWLRSYTVGNKVIQKVYSVEKLF